MSKKVLFIAIGVAVLLIGSLGASFYMMFNKMSQLESVVQTVLPKEDEDGGTEGEKGQSGHVIGQIYELDPFVVNLADEKARYIRLSMSLEYGEKDKRESIEERLPQVKDAILTFIPTKTSEELQHIDGKKDLRSTLLSQFNSFFGEEVFTNIYFTEFVIQ